jgi:hypothetical protein
MRPVEHKMAGVKDAALKLLPYRPIWVKGVKFTDRIDLETNRKYQVLEWDDAMIQNLAALVVQGDPIEERGVPQVVVPFSGELLWDLSGKEIAEKLVPQVEEKMEMMRQHPESHP